jgi:hypothetical protein
MWTPNQVLNMTVAGGENGAPFGRLCNLIGENIQAEVNLEQLTKKYGKGIMSRLLQGGALKTRYSYVF